MCGIAGLIYNNSKFSYNICNVLQNMAASLKHRGPDDEGFVIFNNDKYYTLGSNDTQKTSWLLKDVIYAPSINIDNCNVNGNIGLAHRRLSIIDLSEMAHLPMCTDDSRYWITYNGEIYNYIELRNELINLGYKFKTTGDTEVILASYDKWNLKCLDKFDGMWAFAIYDRKEKILFGARDRYGVKPFYYYKNDDLFAFSSEIKAILKIPEIETSENELAVFEHLYLGQTERYEQGFFNNIFELLPSNYFIYDAKNAILNIKKYYQLIKTDDISDIEPNELAKHIVNIKELLFSSIEKRLRSDVPIGFCLSGGLDSTSIVSISNIINKNKRLEQLQSNLHTFTAAHENSDCDESKWAEIVAKDNFLSFKYQCNSKNLLEDLKDIIYYQEVPLFSTSTYAQSKVMQLAKQKGITILLDGQGGDEVFAGYPVFYLSYYIELLKNFKLLRLVKEIANLKNAPINKKVLINAFSKILLEKLTPKALEFGFNRLFKNETKYLQKETMLKFKNKLSLSNEYSTKTLNEKLFEFQTDHYLKKLLRFEDRCSMQYQIESRTPFADDRALIEYMFNLPGAYKINQGWSKYLLREALKGIIPEEIRQRTDKKGFSTPNIWLKEIANEMKTAILNASDNKYIDNNKLLHDWDEIFQKNQFKKQELIWRYYNYLLWKDMFFNNSSK